MFHGVIDEVYLFDRALLEDEIHDYLGIVLTGLPTVNQLAGRLYPNPAKENVFFEPFKRYKPYTLSITNLSGERVYEKSFDSGKANINIDGFKSGIYIVTYLSGNRKSVQRLVVH